MLNIVVVGLIGTCTSRVGCRPSDDCNTVSGQGSGAVSRARRPHNGCSQPVSTTDPSPLDQRPRSGVLWSTVSLRRKAETGPAETVPVVEQHTCVVDPGDDMRI